jgi:hypothetical protein
MTNLLSTVEPHAAALESCARAMEGAGIGNHLESGHVALLHRMAADLRSQAAHGRIAHVYRDQDRLYAVGDVHAAAAESAKVAGIAAAAEVGIKLSDSGIELEALNTELDRAFPKTHPQSMHRRLALKAQLNASGLIIEPTKVDEKAVDAMVRFMKKHDIPVPTKYIPTIGDLNAAAEKAKLSISERLQLKLLCEKAGMLDTEGTMVLAPMPKPAVNVARSIFAQIGIDPPAPGRKASLAAVNKAMSDKGFDTRRRIQIKTTLAASGMLDVL